MKIHKILLASVLFFSISSFAQAPKKEWTFLIFLNGHNNLSSFGEMNIKEMEKIGSTKDLNIIVEWGSASTPITKRLYIEKSKNINKVTSKPLKQMKDYDMGNYKNLQSFVRWGIENYPANHYFITVWNHGSGWRRTATPPATRNISFDDNTGNKITTEELGLAMADAKSALGRNVDIYGSDACLMQMVEVAGEMKDSVDYFVGSQETIPAEGWPYLPFLTKWSAAPRMTPREVSILLSKEYVEGYTSNGVYGARDGITFSAWDLSKLSDAYTAIKNFAASLNTLKPADWTKIKNAIPNALSFSFSDYVDLGDFTKQIQNLKLKTIDAGILKDVQQSIHDVVLTTDNGDGFNKATGLSIWLPQASNDNQARYDKLKFSQATGWNTITKQVVK